MMRIGPDPERQRAMAEMLMGNMKPVRHWSDGLSNAGNSLAAALLQNRADEGEARQDEERRQLLAEALGAMRGRPEETIQWNQPDASGATTTTIPGQEPSYQQAMAIMLGNPDAGLEDLGFRVGMMGMEQERRQADVARDDAQRQEQRQWALEDRAADQAFRQQMQREQLAARQPQGTFAGNAMDAQAHNIILSADPSSPEYAAAHAYLSRPETVFQNGQMVTMTPDMGWASAPGQTAPAAGQPQAPLASGGMSAAPRAQPAYFAPGQQTPQAPAPGPAGQQIAPGVTVTPMADPEADRKRAAAAETERRTANIVTQDIDRALSLLDEGAALPMTGFVGNLTSNIGGTPQYDLNALLDTVRANIGFAALQEMRANSPTGGALGQVSEFENRLLQATQGNLAQGQTEEQLRRNLSRVQDFYNEVLGGSVPTPQQVELALRKLEQGVASPRGQMGRADEGAAPAGVDPADWQYMTPEERALFQ